jgi:hypothetical protein
MKHHARRGAVGLVAVAALSVTPASASVGPQGVRPGHNVTVFHNIDMVIAAGGTAGQQTQVDVFRGPHRIATTRGPSVATDEGAVLEVNHGPEGAPQPGDCFEGATPDVRPGDRIVVSHPGGEGGVDEAVVDNIVITRRTSVTRDAATGGATRVGRATRREIWIEGTARYVDAAGRQTPIPVAALDSAEFLGVPEDNQLRMRPNRLEAPTSGTFRARYWDPFVIDRNRNNRSTAYIYNALSTGDGHSMGYGHVDPLPPVSMLVEGLTEQATAAPGCESAPKLASSAGTISTTTLNRAAMSGAAGDTALSVGGWAAPNTTAAQVVLSGGGASVAKPVTLTTGAGQRGWSVSFTKADVAGLPQGTLTARLRVGTAMVGATKSMLHDTVPPSFGVDLPAGIHVGARRVAITGATDAVTYRFDGGAPTRYGGIPIDVGVGHHTLFLTAEDAAGNVTEQSYSWSIAPVPGTVPAGGVPLGSLPSASRLRLPRTRGVAAIRRRGVVLRFTAPATARTAHTRILRIRPGRRNRLVATADFKVRRGANRKVLRSRALRRKLTPGRYLIEISLRDRARRAGVVAAARMRVVR